MKTKQIVMLIWALIVISTLSTGIYYIVQSEREPPATKASYSNTGYLLLIPAIVTGLVFVPVGAGGNIYSRIQTRGMPL